MIVDAAIIAFCGFFIWRGMRRGLFLSLAGFLGFLAAAAAAIVLYRPAAAVLRNVGLSGTSAYVTGAAVVFVAVIVACFFVARALRNLLRKTKWSMLDRAAGGALGGIWALSWVTVALLSLQAVPANAASRAAAHSTLARAIVREGPHFATHTAWNGLLRLFDAFTSRG